MTRIILLCDCAGSQPVNADRIGAALGRPVSRVHHALCLDEIAQAQAAIGSGEVLIACGQEAARFAALAEQLGQTAPPCADIRDRAGWTDGGDPTPKQAALLAETLLPVPATPSIDIEAAGTVLIIGTAEVALAAATIAPEGLAMTLLIPAPVELDTPAHGFQIVAGRLAAATGSLGRFQLRIDRLQMPLPMGRGQPAWSPPRDGATSECDIIVDLTGNAPLFPAPHKRDGYLRADPARPGAVAETLARAGNLVGSFEKPLHVRLDAALCAHSRAGQTGCTRCLDICPTGAISPDGEAVTVDPHICAGCGGCSAVCPPGAISTDTPPLPHLLTRMRVLADTFRAAGGTAPRLLVHDDHGAEMIRLAARFGRGLPADVIPLEVPALNGFGHAEALAALAMGFASVAILPGPRTEPQPLDVQVALARAMGAEGRLEVLIAADPDALEAALHHDRKPAPPSPALPMGSRRQIARLSAKTLGISEPVHLPEGAPYGQVLLDRDACTLCLSCVSLCPSGALIDNPDRPQLRFLEEACLQCGLCATICPEDAITLQPRFDPRDSALAARILHEEEPFCCVECGAPFGTASTVRRIVEKLEGRHRMFAGSAQSRLIQMCEDCRIKAQFGAIHSPDAARPGPRTTDDYLREKKDG